MRFRSFSIFFFFFLMLSTKTREKIFVFLRKNEGILTVLKPWKNAFFPRLRVLQLRTRSGSNFNGID